jgi:hypothetical protein
LNLREKSRVVRDNPRIMSEDASRPRVTPPPLPAVPYAQPVGTGGHWVAPYASPRAARPGIITTIGVISIVVASLSLLANLAGGANVLVILAMSKARAAMLTATVTAAKAKAQADAAAASAAKRAGGAPALTVGPRGLNQRARLAVIRALEQVRPLNDERRNRLDALLAKAGRDVIVLNESSLTAENVRRNVSQSGMMPTARSGAEGPVYFVLGNGKIEVDDTHAVFFPARGADGTADQPVRVAKGLEELVGGLTDNDVQAFVADVRSRVSSGVRPEQIRGLEGYLKNSEQALVLPPAPARARGAMPAPAQQITSAVLAGDGQLTVVTTSGAVSVDSSGNATFAALGGGIPLLGTSASRITAGAVAAVSLASLGELLLAGYLLIIGILTLRQNPRGRTLHFVYVGIKLLLLIGGPVAWVTFLRRTNATGHMPSGSAVLLTIWTLAGAIYPIALLIVLNTKSVREYFETATV